MQVGLELALVFLAQPPECWDTGMHYQAWLLRYFMFASAILFCFRLVITLGCRHKQSREDRIFPFLKGSLRKENVQFQRQLLLCMGETVTKQPVIEEGADLHQRLKSHIVYHSFPNVLFIT